MKFSYNDLVMVSFIDFFASSRDTVSLAPGFGLSWNKTADERGDEASIPTATRK